MTEKAVYDIISQEVIELEDYLQGSFGCKHD